MQTKFFKQGLLACFFAFLLLSFATEALASHFRGAQATWQKVAGNEVNIKIRSAWRTLAIGGTTFNLGDGTLVTVTAGDLVLSLSDLNLESYGVYETNINHTYTGPGPWNITLNDCCRIGNLVNAPNDFYKVITVVDLSGAQTGSSVGSIPPLLQMLQGTNTVPIAVSDPDGAISCRMANTAESSITAVAMVASGTLSVDAACVLTWDASAAANKSKYAVQVIMSEGGLDTALDFIIEITDAQNAPPECMLNGDMANTISVGQPFSISMTGTDVDDANLTVTHLGLPAGATLTPVSGSVGAQPFVATFDWTPLVSGANAVTVLFFDSFFQQGQCSFSITVNDRRPLDHFQCYKVGKSTKLDRRPKVDLEDQFGLKEDVKVKEKPKFFCAPVHKDLTLADDLDGPHLTCYEINGAKPNVEVTVDNQFGEDQIFRLNKGKLLCVPSKKTKVEFLGDDDDDEDDEDEDEDDDDED